MKLERLMSYVRQHLLLLLMVAYVCSAYFPTLGLRLRTPITQSISISMLHLMLATLLFVLGLSVPREKLAKIIGHGKWIAASLLVRCITCMVLFAICNVLPATCTAAILGLTLVMVAPAAASSAGWSMQIRANESTTVALIVGTTLSSAIIAPWILLLGRQIAPGTMDESLALLSSGFTVEFVIPWVVLPTIAGIAVRAIFPELAKSLYRYGHAASPVILLLLNYSNGSSSLPRISSTTTTVRAAIILGGCTLAILTLSFLMRLAISPAISEGARDSAVLGTVMSNTGLVLVIATMAIPDAIESHLAIIAYTFVQHIVVATWAATRPAGDVLP